MHNCLGGGVVRGGLGGLPSITDLVFGDLLKLFDFVMMGVSTLDDDGISLKESDIIIV